MLSEHDELCLKLAVELQKLDHIYVSVFKEFDFKGFHGEIDICGYNFKDGSYLIFEVKTGKTNDEKARLQLLKAMGYIYKVDGRDYIKAYYVTPHIMLIEFLYKDNVLKDYKYGYEYKTHKLDVLVYNLLQNERFIR